MWDSQHLLYFLLGLVGALLTLYLAKQVVIPEARPLINVEPLEEEAQQSREAIEKTRKDLDKARAMMTDQPLNSYYLTRVFEALVKSLNDEQLRLEWYERRLLRNQLLSRSLGFGFFILLGGVFAALFTGQIKVSLQAPNGGSLPEFFQAIVIGAGWTGLLSIFGIRGVQAVATDSLGQVGELAKKRIDSLQNSLLERIQAGQGGGTAPAAAPNPEELASWIAEQCDEAKKDVSAHVDKVRESLKRAV